MCPAPHCYYLTYYVLNSLDAFGVDIAPFSAMPDEEEVLLLPCMPLTNGPGYSPEPTVAVPIGDRGGVPTSAADLDVAALLHATEPEVARQCVDPTALLLPAGRRPLRLKRCFLSLHPSYPALVLRNVKAGLQRLVRASKVWKHRGRRMAGVSLVRT